MSSAVGSAPPAHGASDSLSARTQTIPAVPAVNGHSTSIDHSRRPAPTVTPTGATGFSPNGGALGASQNKPQVQFGSLGAAPDGPAPDATPPPAVSHQASASLNINQLGARSNAPSPIPQPANPSGGRPPSSFQGQGNGLVFGQQADAADPAALARPLSQLQLGDSHMRRNSSQSVHSDVGNHGLPTGPQGRNYVPAGRGRGGGYQGYHNQHHNHHHHHQHHHQHPQQQQQQQPFAPSYNNHNAHNSHNSRGGGGSKGAGGASYTQSPARGQPFQYQGSPHLQNRTPMMNTTPGGTPYMQPNQMIPMPGAHNGVPYYQTAADPSIQQHYNQQLGIYPQVVQYAGFPPSPRAAYQQSAYGAPPMQHSFSNQPQPPPQSQPQPPLQQQPQSMSLSMSRQSSQISLPDRPGSSTLEQHQHPHPHPQAPHTPSLPSQSSHSATRTPSVTGVPTTAATATASRSNFAPPKKTMVTIKNAAGEVVDFKNQKQASASPAPASQLPATTPAALAAATTVAAAAASAASSSAPPSRTGSAAPEAAQARADASQTAKTDEEKRRAMQEAVKARIAQESAGQSAAPEAAQSAQSAQEDDKAEKAEKAEKKDEKKDEKEVKKDEKQDEKVKKEEKEVKKEDKEVEIKTEDKDPEVKEEKAVEDKEVKKEKKDDDGKADAKAVVEDDKEDEDAEFERIAAEMAAAEEEEARREAEYAQKKAAEKEAKLKKEREEAEEYERNMKQAEAEAEAAELAREKEREAAAAAGGSAGADDEEKRRLFAELTGKKAPAPASASSDNTPAGHTPGQSGTATPVSDVSMGPPLRTTPLAASKRAKVADLTLDTKKPIEPPEPSATLRALQSARKLNDISSVNYPSEIASPNPALNQNAPAHRAFKYDKAFLLQFQNIFKEKPTLDWDTRIRDALGGGDGDSSARPGGGSSARTPMNRSASNKIPPPGHGFAMGTFGRPPLPPGTTSEQRYAASNAAMRSGALPGFGSFGRGPMAPSMVRTPSNNLMGGSGSNTMPGSPRVGGSSRGGSRAESKRSKQNAKHTQEENKSMPLTAGMNIGTLHTSETGWKPHSAQQSALGPVPGGGDGHLDPAMVQRKVKAALNKMTPNTFDKISNQILDIAAQSKNETDGRTLRQVIQLTFEKATDEAHWASMYANFCRKMLENMSPDIKDENIKDKTGQVVAGGNLFRKYLLNRCQEEFERGWKVNLPPRKEGETEEAAMLSDEYYQAAAAKRRGLGLVRFIGELFKLGMLTERIMHECVKKLVDYEGTPEEAEVESLTSLLRTIGKQLEYPDTSKTQQRIDVNLAQQRMDVYFTRIKNTMDRPDLPSRLRFMLMDIVDLRKKHWVSKDDNKGPKTIAEIRAEEEEKARQAELQRLASQTRGGRGGGGGPALGRGDARSFSSGYGQVPPPDNSNRLHADDLRRLSNRNARNPTGSHGGSLGPTLGPRTNSGRRGLAPSTLLSRGGEDSGASSRTGTPPAGRDKEKKDESSTNAFSALAALENEGPASPPSNPASPPTQKAQPERDAN